MYTLSLDALLSRSYDRLFGSISGSLNIQVSQLREFTLHHIPEDIYYNRNGMAKR
jgi:hypothetical protein